jgi:hypothetical protein
MTFLVNLLNVLNSLIGISILVNLVYTTKLHIENDKNKSTKYDSILKEAYFSWGNWGYWRWIFSNIDESNEIVKDCKKKIRISLLLAILILVFQASLQFLGISQGWLSPPGFSS